MEMENVFDNNKFSVVGSVRYLGESNIVRIRNTENYSDIIDVTEDFLKLAYDLGYIDNVDVIDNGKIVYKDGSEIETIQSNMFEEINREDLIKQLNNVKVSTSEIDDGRAIKIVCGDNELQINVCGDKAAHVGVLNNNREVLSSLAKCMITIGEKAILDESGDFTNVKDIEVSVLTAYEIEMYSTLGYRVKEYSYDNPEFPQSAVMVKSLR